MLDEQEIALIILASAPNGRRPYTTLIVELRKVRLAPDGNLGGDIFFCSIGFEECVGRVEVLRGCTCIC
jgi:hypothetical protein